MDLGGGASSGRSVLILSLVVGCFALLWPRIFYPMLQTSFASAPDIATQEVSGTYQPSILPCCHPVTFTKELNALYFTELCNQLKWRADRRREDTARLLLPPEPRHDIWTPGLAGWCRDELARACGTLLDEPALERYRRAMHRRDDGDAATANLTRCLETTYGVRREEVRPPRALLQPAAGQAHHERRAALHPSMRDVPHASHGPAHAMGRQPKRVLDRMARPGPQPGSRPTPGGYGAVPQSTKATGAMGIIMPIYTIGIVLFFVYTIMKVMFKNPEDGEPTKDPVIKDFHLTTEYRPYTPQRAAANGAAPRHRPVVVRRPAETAPRPAPAPTPASSAAAEDAEIDQLRRRLEETERAMERIMKQMSTVSEKLNVAKISSNIKALKQDAVQEDQFGGDSPPSDLEVEQPDPEDLWGSMDSVASDSMASERSLSMESLAQTEASLASLEDDVDRAAQAAKKKTGKNQRAGTANGDKKVPVGGTAADPADGTGARGVRECASDS
ncbi:uncharacterized protein LOC119107123 isoform X2 [Pollicipes pollicipes]|uniref:uncharacterized protein LOC119107123 isoform X2 n=1 Tax=Pollicipes pollicipes TaxID=41117 RepID=UPI0018850887|nr:uncharacterized protein LOC119107123 isoform X2 [Pollicipes pollicipes]